MGRGFERVALVVLDGVGCGEAEDTSKEFPQDGGANSLLHASQRKPLDTKDLQNLGLEFIPGLSGIKVVQTVTWTAVRGAFGSLRPTFAGNGSPEGHQALTGHQVKTPYRLFNKTGFPPELVIAIERVVDGVVKRPVKAIRYPGTDDVNGEDFFRHPSIGDVHYSSRDPKNPFFLPIYASSDSLVQVALHMDVMPLEMMETVCRAIRTGALSGEFQNVARVILRVWGGEPGSYIRLSEHRKDFGIDPDGITIVDHLSERGVPIFAVGKAAEMLNDRGFDSTRVVKGETDEQRIAEVARLMREGPQRGFVFANLKNTDEKSGHMRKPELYVDHLGEASRGIGVVMDAMRDEDLLIVTSDHGTDPTHSGHKNHTRENVPIMAFSRRLVRPVELGIRQTYSDVAATINEIFDAGCALPEGTSFLQALIDAQR